MRLIYVASDFTRYDEYAIAQINRSIEPVRYRDTMARSSRSTWSHR